GSRLRLLGLRHRRLRLLWWRLLRRLFRFLLAQVLQLRELFLLELALLFGRLALALDVLDLLEAFALLVLEQGLLALALFLFRLLLLLGFQQRDLGDLLALDHIGLRRLGRLRRWWLGRLFGRLFDRLWRRRFRPRGNGLGRGRWSDQFGLDDRTRNADRRRGFRPQQANEHHGDAGQMHKQRIDERPRLVADTFHCLLGRALNRLAHQSDLRDTRRLQRRQDLVDLAVA